MKKIISAILFCTTLFSIAACSEKPQTAADTTSAVNQTEAVTENPEKPDFPDKNWEGADFNIQTLQWGLYNNYFFAEDENGDSMNDALYARQRNVEEALNIKVINNFYNVHDMTNLIKSSVMSGTADYDLFFTHCIDGLGGLVTNHYLYDWYDIPVIELSKSYWNKSMNENLSIANHLFYAVSDFQIADPNAIFFNKQLAEQYGIGSSSSDSVYSIVKSGEWTIDRMADIAKTASIDLDGDGSFTKEDQYGFVGEVDWMFCSFMHSCNQFIVQKNGEGMPELCLNTEKMVNIVDKVYNLCYSDNSTWLFPYGDFTNKYVSFDSGRALFYLVPLNAAKTYRATEFDFGILPYPKYDEAQVNYLSTDWSGLMVTPITLSDPELFGCVMELFAYYGQQNIHPVYYDIMLSTKLTRDDESQEMLEIIYDNIVYDFGLNLTSYSGLLYCVPQLMQQKSKDFASFYQKNYKSVEKSISDLVEAAETYND